MLTAACCIVIVAAGVHAGLDKSLAVMHVVLPQQGVGSCLFELDSLHIITTSASERERTARHAHASA